MDQLTLTDAIRAQMLWIRHRKGTMTPDERAEYKLLRAKIRSTLKEAAQ